MVEESNLRSSFQDSPSSRKHSRSHEEGSLSTVSRDSKTEVVPMKPLRNRQQLVRCGSVTNCGAAQGVDDE